MLTSIKLTCAGIMQLILSYYSLQISIMNVFTFVISPFLLECLLLEHASLQKLVCHQAVSPNNPSLFCNYMYIVNVTCTIKVIIPSYVTSEHAGVLGLSSRTPFSNIPRLVRGLACTPLYGVLPPLKISHIVTPYDHYRYIYNVYII